MFHNMHYAYEVYLERSFSKAAENLFITQPSLSAAIKKIESRVGAQIFDRTTSPVGLTECGREYIKAVERIMDVEAGFEHYLGDMGNLKTGSLTIGGSNFFASFILPPLIAAFRRSYPDIRINLTETDTYHLEQRLAEGSVDFIVDNFDFGEETYAKRYFYSEHLLLAVPDELPAAWEAGGCRLTLWDVLEDRHLEEDFPPVPLSLFAETPFVLLRPGNDTRTRADRFLQEAGVRPPVALELEQLASAFNVACCGMGATFISDTLAKEVKSSREVGYYKLSGPLVERDVHFYYRHSKYVTHAMERFLQTAARPGPP